MMTAHSAANQRERVMGGDRSATPDIEIDRQISKRRESIVTEKVSNCQCACMQRLFCLPYLSWERGREREKEREEKPAIHSGIVVIIRALCLLSA
jgi:hypothetical protein